MREGLGPGSSHGASRCTAADPNAFVGNPIHGFAGFSLTKPLTDAAVTDILAIVMWVAWTQLAACVLTKSPQPSGGSRCRDACP